MPTRLPAACAATLLLLAACEPIPPAVASFNGDSVSIQENTLFAAPNSKALVAAEAERICQKGHRKRAEYVSTRTLPDYVVEHLFLCLN